ncbi:MAG TPA: PBP1A family penicillin-binding protein, partial [Nitrospiria bacterium]|nr:PBP1A family penicillin-binding protein [Nitrospiria bacterium]
MSPYESKHDKDQTNITFEYLEMQNQNRPVSWKKKLLWALGGLAILLSITVGLVIWIFSKDLPPIEALRAYQPSLISRVYGDDQRLLGQFYIEKRILVPLNQMPKELFQAVIATEDTRFYEHGGIDFLGILRAFLTNLESLKIRQGASTITQQLARSLFLSPERSFKRKVKEALLARKMEKALTKDEILEIYLNQIYFGHGAYGVQSAARTYFRKDVGELSLAECAFLAGLPRAPNDYSPYFNPEKAKQRQGVVLRRMTDEGFITEQQYRKAYQENLYFQKLERDQELAPYLMEYVRQYLIARYGESAVYRGGLNVYTTINLDMQHAAVKALRDGLREVDKRQGYRGPVAKKSPSEVTQMNAEGNVVTAAELREGDVLEGLVTATNPESATVIAGGLKGKILAADLAWARKRLTGPDLLRDVEFSRSAQPPDILQAGDVIKVGIKKLDKKGAQVLFTLEQDSIVEGALLSLDPKTGAIKAMVGGYDFKRSEFNRAVTAKRQPGSAFKPFIYAAAMDAGLSPSTIVVDAPVIFDDPVLDKVWKPVNYEGKFYGPISLREALAHSRNVATVRLLERVGIKNAIEMARKAGITSPLTYDLSLALGSSSLSLSEMVSGYGVFANQGIRAEPFSILLVTDSNGQSLENHVPLSQQVITKETAYMVTNMMEDVIQKGTGWRAKTLGKQLAGKTGTTNDFTDAWFVGFAPNLTAGVWVGFDDQR